MRFFFFFFFFLVACSCSSSVPPSSVRSIDVVKSKTPETTPKGEVRMESFESAALGVSKEYFVYLPKGYGRPDKRYPVIYMLHGLGGSEDNWLQHMGLAKVADSMDLQAIVVMPDGDNSFYMNTATPVDYKSCTTQAKNPKKDCVKIGNYEDYISKDLVAHIDATYQTIASREARAIGGFSMGGYGALMLGMLHKDTFSSVASHSGVDSLLYAGPVPYEKGKVILVKDPLSYTKMLGRMGGIFLEVFGKNIDNWKSHDPSTLAQKLTPGQLSIYMDCGTEDEYRLQHGASYLHEVLESKNIKHTFSLLSGRHDEVFWSKRIDDSLLFHVAHFSKFVDGYID